MTDVINEGDIRFAITCDTMCQGLTVAAGDIYTTKEEAEKELLDLRTERDKTRVSEGEEPEGEVDDFDVEEIKWVDGKWAVVDTDEEITINGEEE